MKARNPASTRTVLSLAVLALASPAAGFADAPPPLTLEEAHAMALAHHPGIAAAGYRALAAGEAFKQVRSGLLPQAYLYGSLVQAESRNTSLMAGSLSNSSVDNRKAFGAGASQLITDFGRTSNLVASSRLEASAESRNAEATREQVLIEVDRDFFGALQAQAVLAVARQTVATRQLLLDRVSILAENKLKSELDVSFARLALEDGRLLLQKAQSDLDSAYAALATVLGSREQLNFELVDRAPAPAQFGEDVAPLVERALRERPELASLRDQRDAALRLAQSQRDARLPTISAVIAAGDAPSHDARLPDNYAAGAIQVSVPLFAGGLYLAREREAQLRAHAASEQLRGAEDDVSRDVRVAWLSLNNARERFRTTQQLGRYAADAYQLADARYRAGSSSIVELSQAQLELTSAQIAQATARYEVLIRESDLAYSVGGFETAPRGPDR